MVKIVWTKCKYYLTYLSIFVYTNSDMDFCLYIYSSGYYNLIISFPISEIEILKSKMFFQQTLRIYFSFWKNCKPLMMIKECNFMNAVSFETLKNLFFHY